MRGILRVASVVGLSLSVMAGNGAVCAGWAPAAEARMACCTDGDCPMYRQPHGSSAQPVTQSQADACCASSEPDRSSQPIPTVITTITPAVLGSGVAVTIAPPSRVLSDGWRTAAPPPIADVPRHLLLSIFLI